MLYGVLLSYTSYIFNNNLERFFFLTSNLTETEDIKKRWQEYIEELYKKELLDPDHHNSVMVFPVVMYGCESWTIKKTER